MLHFAYLFMQCKPFEIIFYVKKNKNQFGLSLGKDLV